MYYLETSAVRALSGKLSSIANLSDSYTSALAVFEILSGITAKEYDERRRILLALSQSRLSIDWAYPTQLMLDAFGLYDRRDTASAELQKLLKITLEAESLTDANSMCIAQGTRLQIQELKSVREDVVSHLFQDISQRQDKYKDDYDYHSMKDVYESYRSVPEEDSKAIDERNRFVSLMVATILKQTAVDICQNVIRSSNPNCALQLIDHYNHSLDIHFLASAIIQEKRIAYRQMPKRNDLGDITHFAYLKSNKTIRMVSSDKLVINTMMEIDKRKILDPEQYLKTR